MQGGCPDPRDVRAGTSASTTERHPPPSPLAAIPTSAPIWAARPSLSAAPACWGLPVPDGVAHAGPADVAEGIGEDAKRAEPPLVQNGEQEAFAVADLLRKDATAGTGLASAAAPLVAEAFGLSRLPCGEPLCEVLQFAPGEAGQGWLGEPFPDRCARGVLIALQGGEQVGGGGETDRGHAGVRAEVDPRGVDKLTSSGRREGVSNRSQPALTDT